MNNFKTGTLRNGNFSNYFLAKRRKQKLSSVSNTHLLDEVGDYNGLQRNKSVYESSGNGVLNSSHITNQTIVSFDGTSSITVTTGQLQFGAGWVSNILLSDNTFYKCEERTGTIAYDSSELNHGTLVNINHNIIKIKEVVNYTNKEGYNLVSSVIIPKADSKYLKVGDYPWAWIFSNNGAGFYTDYKGNLFKPSENYTVEVGNTSDYDSVTRIDVPNQNLTTNLDFLGKFSNLEELYIFNNPIGLCNLSGLNKLKAFNSTNTNVSALDTSDLSDIRLFYSNDTNLTDFTMQNKSEITDLTLANNSTLTSATIENNPSLITLNLSGCNISNFDLSTNTMLTSVNLYNNNNVTSCNLANLAELDLFKIQNGSLTTLNTDDCVALRVFNCFNNDIVTLDFANNPLLEQIYTHNNKLTAATNSQLLIELDTHGLSNRYFQSSIFGGGVLTSAGLAALANLQAKGWVIVGL
jgi:hypothetical protein